LLSRVPFYFRVSLANGDKRQHRGKRIGTIRIRMNNIRLDFSIIHHSCPAIRARAMPNLLTLQFLSGGDLCSPSRAADFSARPIGEPGIATGMHPAEYRNKSNSAGNKRQICIRRRRRPACISRLPRRREEHVVVGESGEFTQRP